MQGSNGWIGQGKVQREDTVLLDEHDLGVDVGGITGQRAWRGYEIKLHAHPLEDGQVLKNDPVDLLEVLGHFILPEDKELVGLLLIKDQVLATNAGDILLIIRLPQGYDLVGFSGHGLQ